MSTCGASRLLLVGFVAGTVVSWLTGSDLLGWTALVATVAAIAVAQRQRGTAVACAVPASRRAATSDTPTSGTPTSDTPTPTSRR